MASVGERLRHERESRGRTIEQIADATGIGATYLAALERNDFNGLPGRAFGKLYIRAYGEALQFDPQPLVDDYDREQRLVPGEPRPEVRWRPETTSAPEAPEAAPVTAKAPEAAFPAAGMRAPGSKRRLAAALIGIAVVATALYFGLRATGDGEKPKPAAVAVSSAPEPARPREVAPSLAPPPAAPVVPAPAVPGRLRVTESGLGRRVVHSRLEGASDRFAPGEVAWFQTRVLGGRGGETLRHVWIFDGRAQQSIVLRLSGSDWRTQSSKTLYKPGPWSVEARDESGRVLASAAFTCEAAGGPGAR